MIWPFRHCETFPNIENIVGTALRNHPPECIFALGARERIIAKCQAAQTMPTTHLIEILVAAFHAEEIYCPHEGIDRRADYPLETLAPQPQPAKN